MFGRIPAFYSMCNANQLPTVAKKSIANDSSPNTSCNANEISTFVISKFMNPPNQLEMSILHFIRLML